MQLVGLAGDTFGTLGAAEAGFLQATEEGRTFTWEAGSSIRAGLVKWLCAEPSAAEKVKFPGVLLQGAQIDGPLDLDFLILRRPLLLIDCMIPGGISLRYATVGMLILDGSQIGGLAADAVRVRGSLFMRRALVRGTVRLPLARIDGNLECDGAQFCDSRQGIALHAEQMRVGGSLMLRSLSSAEGNRKFIATGLVRLSASRIEGQLSCDGATFQNPNGPALLAERSKFGTSVFLTNGSYSGGVSFSDAEIEGSFFCDGSRFSAGSTCEALVADGLTVRSSVLLRNGFQAQGIVRLPRARIGGSLDCERASFDSLGRIPPRGLAGGRPEALIADSIEVGWAVRLRAVICNGDLAFNSARIAGDLDCQSASFRGLGGLVAEQASIGGRFWWWGVEVRDDTILSLLNTRVGVLVDDEQSWPRGGNLLVDGFVYEAVGTISPTDARTRVRWLERQLEFKPQPYRQLAKVLRDTRQEKQARQVLVALESARGRSQTVSWWRKPLRCLYQTIGYGYEPLRGALYWSAAVILLGWFFACLAKASGVMYPVAVTASPSTFVEPFSPFWYSLDTFLPIHALHQQTAWWPTANELCRCPKSAMQWPCGWWFRFWVWLEILSGWSLTALVIGSLTGLVRRE